MLFWNKICGLIAIFFLSISSLRAQHAFKKPSNHFGFDNVNQLYRMPETSFNKENVFTPRSFAAIPQNYYTQHFGIMCKQELAIEKATKIPFRFRLGSLQQCNYLEGKK